MAILSRVKLSPQQRLDLEDIFAMQASARTDAKLSLQKFISDSNYILNGFSITGIGLNSATVAMTDAAFMFPENSFDFSYFISSPSEPDVVIPDSDLTDGVRNYVEIALSTEENTPLTRAFWDPEANSGDGAEFNQIVNTVVDLTVSFVVSTGGFTGSPDRIPLAIIDTDGTGVIKVILDRRNLFGRLSLPNDLDNEYSWGTKVEPVYSLTMTGVVGTFTAGEEITIGGETATVVSGGGASITFNEPTGINFFNGDSVTGTDSGATGTVNTVLESFSGVDKSLKNQKNINDALMTEIKGIKSTRFWWENSPTLGGLKNEAMSTVAPISGTGKVKWNGTNLVITDNSTTPSSSDTIAAIRFLNSTANLLLTRQDDGLEEVTITLDEIPDSGILTLDQNSNLIPINWDDSTTDIQTTWDGSGAAAATIQGSPAAKKIIITFNTIGDQVDVITDSTTLTKSTVAVVETISIKQGTASDDSIAIGDGQVLYVDLPNPLANTTYSDLGVGSTNYKVADRGDVALLDASYWLAYREGSRLIWRFSGELESGESSEISDNIPQTLLSAIGLVDEKSNPVYTSNIRGVANESLVARSSALTDAVGDSQEDRSGYLRSEDTVLWTGTQLEFNEDIVLELINTKDGTTTTHTIEAANSPITINDLESIWILVDRGQSAQINTVFKSDTTAIPVQTEKDKDVFVLFKRIDTVPGNQLYLPFTKQLMTEGQNSYLGASGSGSSIIKSTYLDPVSTTLPTGATVTIDGIAGVNGDTVLYTNLAVNNNRIYELSGVGVAIAWDPIRAFSGQFDPEDGDSVRVLSGDSFADQLAVFDGTDFKVNDVVRFFDGVSGNFWELGSIKTSTLGNNTTGNVFTVAAFGSENIILSYSIQRGTAKETGELYITTDGTDAATTRTNSYLVDPGITFEAVINSGDLELNYTSTNTGLDATMKYFARRWSDSAGGPTGLPNYSGFTGSSTLAAGNIEEVQFHGGGGTLDADSRFKWDATEGSINLNGLYRSALSSGLTINDNQASASTLFTYPIASFNYAVIEYSVVRSGIYRVGRILVANDTSSGVGFSDDSVDTGVTGVTFSAVISGANLELQYTSTATGFSGTFKYSIKKWS